MGTIGCYETFSESARIKVCGSKRAFAMVDLLSEGWNFGSPPDIRREKFGELAPRERLFGGGVSHVAPTDDALSRIEISSLGLTATT